MPMTSRNSTGSNHDVVVRHRNTMMMPTQMMVARNISFFRFSLSDLFWIAAPMMWPLLPVISSMRSIAWDVFSLLSPSLKVTSMTE